MNRVNECRTRFEHLAADAVRKGIVTRSEIEVITRPGSRKAGYWCRHLFDLHRLINRRGDNG